MLRHQTPSSRVCLSEQAAAPVATICCQGLARADSEPGPSRPTQKPKQSSVMRLLFSRLDSFVIFHPQITQITLITLIHSWNLCNLRNLWIKNVSSDIILAGESGNHITRFDRFHERHTRFLS